MSTEAHESRWPDWLWLIACALLSSIWCLTAASQLSATFDEPTYIKEGLERWRSGSYRKLMRLGTMPLPVDVQTLPLYVWERWRGQPFDVEADFHLLLPPARAVTLGFWWLLLFFGMRMGRELAGPWGGRLAVAMLACEPSLVAHAALATTDIALTALLLGFVYYFRRGREAGTWRRRVVPALWLALAILAKASGLIFGGLCMILIEFDRLVRCGAFRPAVPGLQGTVRQAWVALAPFRRDAAWIVGGGLVGVLLYCGSDWSTEPSFIRWAQTLPEGPFASSMLWLAENLRIFTNGGEGIVQQFKHNVRGHGTFILGQVHYRALWYYFPLLLTIKLTLPLLLIPLALLVIRPSALRNWALVAAFFLIAISPAFRVQIGLRLVLPIVVLAIVGLAAALAAAWREENPGWGRGFLTALAAWAIFWPTAALAAGWPHALCHVNELYGGTWQGYRLVNDANYDWGQGLFDLCKWEEAHGIKLTIWAFSADPRARQWWPVLPLHGMDLECPEDVRAKVQGKVVAVSTTLLTNVNPLKASPGHRHAAEFFRQQQPIGRTMTFLIYDCREKK